MGRKRVSGAPGGDNRRGHAQKAPPGLRVVERNGHWHIVGTLRVGGRSIRIRKSTELRALAETREDAETLRLKIEQQVRNEVIHGVKPSVPVIVAIDRFLSRPRRRPIGRGERLKMMDIIQALAFRPASIGLKLVQHMKAGGTLATFGEIPASSIRILDEITDAEWHEFIDTRQKGNKPETRERYLNSIMGFLAWCHRKPRQWIREMPFFERDQSARKPKHRRARRVAEMTPQLILFMIEHASPHLAGQIAAEWATGARVSSVLYGCRLCDYVAAPGREQITFHDTKNGEPVVAAVHPIAAQLMRKYLEWRGNLRDREAPLFLTHRKQPYTPSGKEWGGQNKTAFTAMKRRAIRSLRRRGASEALKLWRLGEREAARDVIAATKDQAGLIAQITQHWFRHNLATTMLSLGGDLRSAMEQGGWLDPISVLGYTHDVPERRRELVNLMVPDDTSLTREPTVQEALA